MNEEFAMRLTQQQKLDEERHSIGLALLDAERRLVQLAVEFPDAGFMGTELKGLRDRTDRLLLLLRENKATQD